MSTQLLATFTVAGAVYGVDALAAQEVLRSQPMSRVPLAPPDVRGLINLRGQVVTAIDLRRRLGLATESDVEPMNLVLRTDEGPIAFLVDEIGEVLEIPADELEPAPETVRNIDRSLIAGIHTLPDHLLVVLDADRLCAARAVGEPAA